jgi:hypothetical protein
MQYRISFCAKHSWWNRNWYAIVEQYRYNVCERGIRNNAVKSDNARIKMMRLTRRCSLNFGEPVKPSYYDHGPVDTLPSFRYCLVLWPSETSRMLTQVQLKRLAQKIAFWDYCDNTGLIREHGLAWKSYCWTVTMTDPKDSVKPS